MSVQGFERTLKVSGQAEELPVPTMDDSELLVSDGQIVDLRIAAGSLMANISARRAAGEDVVDLEAQLSQLETRIEESDLRPGAMDEARQLAAFFESANLPVN